MTRSAITVLFVVPVCTGVFMMFDGSRSSILAGIIKGFCCGLSLLILTTSILDGIIGREKLGRRMFIGWCLGVLGYGIYLVISGRLPATGMADTFKNVTDILFLGFITGGLVNAYHRGF